MAIIKLGAMFDKISGKVGGQSISNRGQITTIRNITYTNKVPTLKQSVQRFITASISNAYRFLTSAQISSWSATSFNYTYINRVGDVVTRNAFQTYSFCNQNLELIKQPLLTSAPLYVPVSLPKINIIDTSAGVFEIQSNNATNVYLYALFAVPNLSNGISNAKSQMKFCGTLTSAQLNAGIDIVPLIESVYGALIFPNRISVIIDPINKTTGNRSQEVVELFNQETPMIIQLNVVNGDTITMPFEVGGGYDGSIDWGDGTVTTFDAWNSVGVSHTYTANAIVNVVINGTFPAFYCQGKTFGNYLVDIVQFGTNALSELSFSDCNLLVNVSCSDTPTFSVGATLAFLFQQVNSLVSFNGIENWDLTNVINLTSAFNTSTFTPDISNWNVSNVTQMQATFRATNFNYDIGSWNVSNVLSFRFCFFNSTFNGDISNWNVSSCQDFEDMFFLVSEFNQDLSNWNVSSGTDFENMFRGCSTFNSDLSSWNITHAIKMLQFGTSANFSNANWDAMLIAWNNLAVPPINITISINATHTAAADAAFNNLVMTHGWTITENV